MKIVNVKHEPCDIYIDRRSIYGNPFVIGIDGSREDVIRKHKQWLWEYIKNRKEIKFTLSNKTYSNKEVVHSLLTIRNKVVGCHCKPKDCHGDTLSSCAEWLAKTISPLIDGISHINIYSKSQTRLGQLLSNFAHTPFNHKLHGNFQSIEGYWYWLSTKDDKLRMLYGYEAKAYGRKIRGVDWPKDEKFKKHIADALKYKIAQNKNIQELLIKSNLPFKQYYVYNNQIIEPTEGYWILTIINQIRNNYKDQGNLSEQRVPLYT